MTSQTISPGGIQARISPFAFQHWAKDYYAAHCAYQPAQRFSPARLFLLSRAIELAGKSLHVLSGATSDKIRKLGHDLLRACASSLLAAHGVPALTPTELAELRKANAYYKNKGFEYFWAPIQGFNAANEHLSGPELALRAYPDLPNEAVLVAIVEKLLAVSIP